MKDEFNNECPYDFKNIQFKRYMVSDKTDTGKYVNNLDGLYLGFIDISPGLSISEDKFKYAFTFQIPETCSFHPGCDASLYGDKSPYAVYTANVSVCNNIIMPAFINVNIDDSKENRYFQILNNIVLYEDYSYKYRSTSDNIFYGNTMYFTSVSNFQGNKIGPDSRYIIFGGGCCLNKIESCNSNTFGNKCYSNTFGNNCNFNTFGNDYNFNTFGNGCGSNTFGNGCADNTFGNDCADNTFGNGCGSNTFGNGCADNTFGNDCADNTFGNDCYSNTFGNKCYSNTFGDNCYFNTFGNKSGNNKIAIDRCMLNIFDKGVSYIYLHTSDATSDKYLQNVHVHQGVCGDGSNYIQLEISKRGNDFCTDVKTAKDVEVTL
jgi:hypothetical protein